jgi:putative ABC transport system permease protein
MMWRLRRLVRRFHNLFRHSRADRDLSREINSHLLLLEDEFRRRGLSRDAARYAARRAFGGVEQAKEEQRDARSFRWVGDARQDMQYAARMLRRAPGFTFAAVLTLALGIGANSAIFTVVHAVMLRPLPYPEPERLIGVVQQHKSFGVDVVTLPDYQDWRDSATSLSALAGAWRITANLTGVDEPERLAAAAVTANLFTTLGVTPQLGATFHDSTTDSLSVVLSDRLWRRRFGSAANVLGSRVSLNGVTRTVVGVMPPGFAWPEGVEAWIPLVPEGAMNRGYHQLQVVGRLAPSVTLAAARAELEALAARSAVSYPATNKDWGVQVSSLLDYTVGATSRSLLILAGAAGCVLLIACANVGGLLTARALTRRKEISLRTALGASRSRIMRQLVTESVMLSLLGGIAGVAVAEYAIPALLSLTALPRSADIALDTRMLAVTLIASLVAGLLFGLAPATASARFADSVAIRSRGDVSSGWLRPALLVVQLAAAVVLLSGAGLLLRSFYKLQTVETGLDVDRILTARFFLPRASYPVERCLALYEEMIAKARALPDVTDAAAVSVFPFSGVSANVAFTIPGRPDPGTLLTANFAAATPGYFRAMSIPLVAGRGFETGDSANVPFVAVVNQSMADRYFPGQNPIGQSIQILGPKPRQIVGIIPNLRQRALDLSPEPEIYVPHAQFPTGGMFLVVRTNTDRPERTAASLRVAVRSVNRDVPIASIRTGNQIIGETMSSRRLNLVLLSVFAALALIVSVVGVYGVLSFTVSRQTTEIGIRMALGAARRDVLGLMIRKGLAPVILGVAGGLVLTFASMGVLRTLLFGIGPSDPPSLLAAALVLLLASGVAILVPARRAANIDPLVALHTE